MKLTDAAGSQTIRRLGLSRRKMKFIFVSVLCSGILYVTVASVIGKNGDESRTKRHLSRLPSLHQSYLSTNYIHGDIQNDPKVVGDKANVKSLRLVQVLYRHGDRTPIDRYPKDPYNSLLYWPEGWGRLTDLGKQMHFELGKTIRKRYEGYLNEKYNAGEIYVQSSDKDRTIMSAMADLTGMWPPSIDSNLGDGGKQQFVPVHSISARLDNKIAFTRSCPKYKKEFSEVNMQPSEEAFNLQQRDLYAYLSEHTGLKITSYFNVSDIYDILYVQTCHNRTLPTWTKSVFPDKMISSAERWIKANTLTETMRRLRAGPLLTDIVQNMKRVIGKPDETSLKILEQLYGTPAAKFYVYSGHDTTLSAVLDGLGLYSGKIPPYASSLYFELHENEQSNDYYVKIFYRPDYTRVPEELELKRCSSSPCRFNDFLKSLESYFMDEKEWERQCNDL